ncbi:MAG: amidohydrolase [Raoultibacter sp.]
MAEIATDTIKALGGTFEDNIIQLRRQFHACPEPSGKEFATSQAICEELDKYGIAYRRVAETGIIASIHGTASAGDGEGVATRCIALRSDIDALPVVERTGASYASENKGFMHACGHDCHIAMMLGAARILQDMTSEFSGEARILFQPAEEISIGSTMMIEAGALEGVDTIYGAHIWSEIDAGLFSCEPGRRMAHTDWFRIDIEGVSAHGSMPHRGVDAVVVGAEMVDALQILVSRDISPFEPAVVTIGEFHAGEARNIMAGSAYLTGTVRTWSDELRQELPSSIVHIAEKTAHTFGAEAHVTYEEGNAGLSNDVRCAKRAQLAVAEVLGPEANGRYRGTLSGEDFSEYLRIVPGVFVFIGCRNPEVGASHPQHSGFYEVDESVLVKGSMVAAQYAIDFLQGR